MAEPVVLGRVAIDGIDQLITRVCRARRARRRAAPEPGRERRPPTAASTEPLRELPAVGWDAGLRERARDTCMLPPGWRLLHVERRRPPCPTPGCSTGRMLEMFLALIIALAVAQPTRASVGSAGAGRARAAVPRAGRAALRLAVPARRRTRSCAWCPTDWVKTAVRIFALATAVVAGRDRRAVRGRADPDGALPVARVPDRGPLVARPRTLASPARCADGAQRAEQKLARSAEAAGGAPLDRAGREARAYCYEGESSSLASERLRRADPGRAGLDRPGPARVAAGARSSSSGADRSSAAQTLRLWLRAAVAELPCSASRASRCWRRCADRRSGCTDRVSAAARRRGAGARSAGRARAGCARRAGSGARARSFPPQSLLDSAEAPGSLEQPECASRLRRRSRACASRSSGDALRARVELHAVASHSYAPLPGGANDWLPDAVSVDGKPALGLAARQSGRALGRARARRCTRSGCLEAAAGARVGRSCRCRSGRAASSAAVSGWQLTGVRDDGRPDASLQLTRLARAAASAQPSALEPERVPGVRARRRAR